MNIVEIQHIGFPEKVYRDLEWHFDYMTARVPRGITVDAHIYLTIFGPGIEFWEYEPHRWTGIAGTAAAGIASYKFIDSNGKVQEVEIKNQWLTSSIRIEKCVEITFALVTRNCWAKANGMIFHLK